jgi:hypothetical protein
MPRFDPLKQALARTLARTLQEGRGLYTDKGYNAAPEGYRVTYVEGELGMTVRVPTTNGFRYFTVKVSESLY